MSETMPADMSFTKVRENCRQTKTYTCSRLFVAVVFPYANFRYTKVLLTKNNREDAHPMYFHACLCRTYRGRVIPRKSHGSDFPTQQMKTLLCLRVCVCVIVCVWGAHTIKSNRNVHVCFTCFVDPVNNVTKNHVCCNDQ